MPARPVRSGCRRLHSHEPRVFVTLGRHDALRGSDADAHECDRRPREGATSHEGPPMSGIVTRLIGGDLAALVADPLGEFVRRSRQGGVVPLRIGLARGHLVSDPALVRHVLLDNLDNYDKHTPAFDAVRVALGNGMLTSGGAFWKRQRRIAQPAFHGESVRHFAPIISRLAAETAEAWGRSAAANAPVDACTDMMRVTLRIVAETLFGDDLAETAAEVNRVFPVILACLAARAASPLRPPLWMPTANNRRLRPALASLDAIVARLIATKRRRLATESRPQDGHRDLLTILMLARDAETGDAMSDAQLRDEVMTLMIAGHETTANALSWLWYLLDRHPDEQERLRTELAVATGGRAPTVDDLPLLPRLKAVIQETLRLYPPVWMFDRRALGPDDLAGTKVAKGDLVIFCPYAIHRLPDLWDDPETFRPERFAVGREEQKNKFAYLPFSAGPRTCIGNSFAMIESQIIIGTLLARFRARLANPSPITPKPRVTLRPSRPVELRLEPAPLA
jgi:cytochrome P450